MVHCVLVHEAH